MLLFSPWLLVRQPLMWIIAITVMAKEWLGSATVYVYSIDGYGYTK